MIKTPKLAIHKKRARECTTSSHSDDCLFATTSIKTCKAIGGAPNTAVAKTTLNPRDVMGYGMVTINASSIVIRTMRMVLIRELLLRVCPARAIAPLSPRGTKVEAITRSAPVVALQAFNIPASGNESTAAHHKALNAAKWRRSLRLMKISRRESNESCILLPHSGQCASSWRAYKSYPHHKHGKCIRISMEVDSLQEERGQA
jgi:hypothetical protein